MFPRRDRLPRAQFLNVLKRGRRTASKHFTLISSTEAAGYAVVIPKKIIRLSVKRHYLKRQIFAALHTTNLPPALIVFLKSAPSGVHYQDIVTELQTLVPRI